MPRPMLTGRLWSCLRRPRTRFRIPARLKRAMKAYQRVGEVTEGMGGVRRSVLGVGKSKRKTGERCGSPVLVGCQRGSASLVALGLLGAGAGDLADGRLDLAPLAVAGLFVAFVGPGLFGDAAVHDDFLEALQSGIDMFAGLDD